ncbi:MAG: hypothetical protein ACREXG_11830, partial [Polaromonas sp.]
GKYFATSSYDEISTAILKILNEVQAVNSVFSSASLPVSVNAQGTYLNQIFLGMFRPDASANPRWVGNLKQYQFILEYPDPSKPDPNKATLKLGDSAGNPAISSAGTGFITPDAVSFWTKKDVSTAPDSTGGFFVNDARGAGLAFDSPDGELVEKGGAAQQSRLSNLTVKYASTPSSPRRLYTYCPSGTCVAALSNSANAFSTSNALITDAMLSSVSAFSVASLTRSGPVATVTTGSAHGFVVGDSVTMAGATQAEYNGTKTVATVPSTTQFTFAAPDYPSYPATGAYTAAIPGSPKNISTITRSGSTATVTLAGHGYVTGQTVTIAGADQPEYNGAKVITVVDANTFTYTVTTSESPPTAAGSGTAKVGASTKTIETVANSGVTRTSGSTTVRVKTTANHGFSAGASVTLAGVVDSTGAAVSGYTGTYTISWVGTGSQKVLFEFTLGTAATIIPVSPATTATTLTADSSAAANTITALTRSGSTATATAANHGFLNGQTVSISGTA